MRTYLLRRVAISIPVLIGITVVAFTLLSLAPGDPLLARMDPSSYAELARNPALLEERREELGLNQPVHVRYLTWLGGVVFEADLGFSIVSRQPAVDEILKRVPPTLVLMLAAISLAAIIGVPLGVLSAVRQYSRLDYLLTGFAMLFVSTPNFVLGLAGIYVFGVWSGLLPTSGMQTLGAEFSLTGFVRHLILPALILALPNAAELMRYTRASMLEELNREYITTAHAKGLSNRNVLIRHAFRNSLIPVITVLGLLMPHAIGGAVITEQIFSWPGMGQLAVRAAQDRDTAVMMGIVLLIAVSVLVTNIVIDVVYARVDPRIRLGTV